METNSNCKIISVINSSHSMNPLLINVDNRSLMEEELNNCECSWLENKNDQTVYDVTFQNSFKNSYHGSTKVKGNVCKTLLVLQNKKKNKVQLIEVGECRLERFMQKPSLQSNYDNDEMQTTYEENKTKLLKAFGSKKSNRVSEIRSKTKINSEMMTSQMKDTAADVSVDLKELELADSSVDTCLPPCHRNASTAAEVYLLEDFLTQSELDSMEDEAFTIFNLMPFTQEDSGYTQYFIDSLEHLQNRVSIEKIKILLFVEALLRFINLPVKKLKKSEMVEKISPFSKVVAKKVIENFTIDTAEGRARNVTMDDKIVIHIIVLILIACDYSCNVEMLSKYIPRFNVKKIISIARALCLSTRDKVNWFIKLPLPPPKSLFMRRRK